MSITMPMEEIQQRMDAGDKEIINGVVTGEILPQEQTPVEEPQMEPEVVEPPVEDVQPEPQEPQPEKIDEVKEPEEDPNERYLQLKEQQLEEERLRRIQELKDKEDLIKRERQAREELEQELQSLRERVENPPVITVDEEDNEDDEFVTEYDKKTRQLLKELMEKNQNNAGGTDVMKRLGELERTIQEQQEIQKRLEKDKRNQEQRRHAFQEVENLQRTHPDLTTKKPFDNIHEDYLKFRKDIQTLTKATNAFQLENYIDDYMRGGKIKEKADSFGIKPVEDVDKYFEIMELFDAKRGVKYDKYTGKEIPSVDESGNRIVRRSLEEAYILKNYNKEIEKARQNSYKEVQKKLEFVNDKPVTLNETEVTQMQGGLSVDEVRGLINLDPRKPEDRRKLKDPKLFALYEQAYRSAGMEPPKFRR